MNRTDQGRENVFIAILVPLIMIFFLLAEFEQVDTLVCQKTEPAQGQCKWSEWHPWGTSVKSFPLADLHGARVEVIDRMDDRCSQLVLLLDSGATPFTDCAASGGPEKETIAARVNSFVSNSEVPLLTVQYNERAELATIALFVMGAFVLFILYWIWTVFARRKTARKT